MKRAKTEAATEKSDQQLIRINAGGKIYCTTLKTLTSNFPNSLIASLFKRKETLPLDEAGNYFIDADPTLFGAILNVLRRPSLVEIVPSGVKDDAWWFELDYYGIREYVEMTVEEEEKPKIPLALASKAQLFKETCIQKMKDIQKSDLLILDKILELCGFDEEILSRGTCFDVSFYMAQGVLFAKNGQHVLFDPVDSVDIVEYILENNSAFELLMKEVMGFKKVRINMVIVEEHFTFCGRDFPPSRIPRLKVSIHHNYRKK